MAKTLDINHQLVNRLQNGDQSAARDIYQNYSKAMYNTLIRITGNSDDAQDLLQEAFIKAFQKIDSFRGEATFGSWLKRIVVNTGLAHLRKQKIQFDEIGDDTEILDGTISDDAVEIEAAVIHEQIKKLPSGSRTVLNLYLIEGYSHKQIAEELEITESTSKTQYMRGKAMLRDLLKPKLYGYGH